MLQTAWDAGRVSGAFDVVSIRELVSEAQNWAMSVYPGDAILADQVLESGVVVLLLERAGQVFYEPNARPLIA